MAITTNGKSKPVRTTRKSEIPSIPAFHWIPRLSTQVCSDKNWYAPLLSKAVNTQTEIAPVIPVKTVASNLWTPIHALGVIATASAPNAGKRTSTGMTGKDTSDDPAANTFMTLIRNPSLKRKKLE